MKKNSKILMGLIVLSNVSAMAPNAQAREVVSDKLKKEICASIAREVPKFATPYCTNGQFGWTNTGEADELSSVIYAITTDDSPRKQIVCQVDLSKQWTSGKTMTLNGRVDAVTCKAALLAQDE